MKPATLLQPDYFDAFHCINSACEDTCCAGWIVHVDKLTYGKYQNCSSPELGPALRALITINEKSSSDEDYARIVPDESGCLFLSGGLCSIQLQLGELALSNMCATYPRVINRAGDVLQRSLDLSCPEAARLVLLNPNPMEFREHAWHDGANRPAEYPALDLTGLSGEPYLRYRSVKRRMLAVLQSRLHPVWRRLHVLGSFCEKLASGCSVNDLREDEIQDLEGPQPGVQLETVVELMLARMSAEQNPRRFLECYQEFLFGLQWTTESTEGDLASRYAEAYSEFYLPLMSRHEHILEHYLVNYVHRTLFPFGLPESNLRLRNARIPSSIMAQYMWMVACYAIIKTLLIGMAGFHKSAFGVDHVIKLIQSCAKTFEHSQTFPGQVIELLAQKSMTTLASLSVLIRN